MGTDEQMTKNFKRSEFDCQCGCGRGDISPRLVTLLQDVRDFVGHPIQITSGNRCPAHKKLVGGSDSSSHLYGFAADVACKTSKERYGLMRIIPAKFNRYGIAIDFIHVDVDELKTQEVVWVY